MYGFMVNSREKRIYVKKQYFRWLNVFLDSVNIDSWTTLMFNALPRGNNNVYRNRRAV